MAASLPSLPPPSCGFSSVSVSLLCVVRTVSLHFGPPDTGWSHPEIHQLLTSAKTLFPNMTPVQGSRGAQAFPAAVTLTTTCELHRPKGDRLEGRFPVRGRPELSQGQRRNTASQRKSETLRAAKGLVGTPRPRWSVNVEPGLPPPPFQPVHLSHREGTRYLHGLFLRSSPVRKEKWSVSAFSAPCASVGTCLDLLDRDEAALSELPYLLKRKDRE